MSAEQLFGWASAVFAALSGIAWVRAVWITLPPPIAWLDFAPDKVTGPSKKQSFWNGAAAWLAAIAAFAQMMSIALHQTNSN